MPKVPTQRIFKDVISLALLVLITTIIVAGVVILPRTFPAHAAGATLTVTPTAQHYSNSLDAPPLKIHGTNYGANETVNVYWNYTGPGTGTLEATGIADATGTFNAQFGTPLAAHGTYTIAGVGQTSQLVATTPFTVMPQIYTFPQAAGPGTPTTFYGNAFDAGENVKIYWNYHRGTGTLLTTVASNSTGSFTVNANIPTNVAPGYYFVAGVGQTSNIVIKYNFLIYTPTLALAPLSGAPGTTLTLSAYGFTGLEYVNIYWNNGGTPVNIVQTSPYGYLPPSAISLPSNTAPGSYPVKIVGQTSNLAITNMFTVVAPASSLSLTSGPVGLSVDTTGQGYAPNETVNIIWNYTGPGTGSVVASTAAGVSGVVHVSFAVPAVGNGSYNVAAAGVSSNRVTQHTFMVGNGVATNPATSAPGTSITVVGTGYHTIELVNIYWDNTSGSPLRTTNADANGNVDQAVTIPSGATPGSHSLIAIGQLSGNSYNTSVMVDTEWKDFGFDLAHHRENTNENTVSTANAANLTLKWSTNSGLAARVIGLSATISSTLETSPVYANGVVYLASAKGTLNAYDAKTGALKWQYNSNTTFPSYSAPLVDLDSSMVYFGTAIDRPSPFYAVDLQTGTLKWSMILPGSQFCFPTVAFHKLYIGISNDGGIAPPVRSTAMFAVDETAGNVVWQNAVNGGIWGATAIDIGTNTIFTGVGDPNISIRAFNANTGAPVWTYVVPNSGPDDDVGSGITVSNGLVYASSKNGSVYALNESDGTLAWSKSIGSQSIGNISTQAVGANGVLYVGSLNHNLYALHASTGKMLWKRATGNYIFSSPALANGVVYVASNDFKVYAINAASGAILWSYAMGNTSLSSPILVNGWLYCTSTDGKLYAFSL